MSADHRTLFQHALAQLGAGNLAGAEAAAQALLAAQPDDAGALHLMAVVRNRQNRLPEAAHLLRRAIATEPQSAELCIELGQVMRRLEKPDDALAAFQAALAADPAAAAAHFEIGLVHHGAGRLAEAEQAFRAVLALIPGHAPTLLALSGVLLAADRPQEAQAASEEGLRANPDTDLVIALEQNRAASLLMQNRQSEALDSYQRMSAAAPALHGLERARATLMEDLGQFDEAVTLLSRIVAREPDNLDAHKDLNSLLHRLGRNAEFLKSFDSAPPAAPFGLAKASLMLKAGRSEEAHALYRDLATRDAGNLEALMGTATALNQMNRFGEAVAVYNSVLRQRPQSREIQNALGATLLRVGDPQEAMAAVTRVLAEDPADQTGLAILGDAYRMRNDQREAWLQGYDDFIRVYDLPAPEGYSDMAAFNRDLDVELDRLHPPIGKIFSALRTNGTGWKHRYLPLRYGTQTTHDIFGFDHGLIDLLRQRVDQAVALYLNEMREDRSHPFLSRRSAKFRYTGSWSSRLHDRGFQETHIHPGGWISSVYYVAVPPAISDSLDRQGWIKFGEPPYDLGYQEPVRRSIQPVAGRLILFPSYIWHGTVPFRSDTARTTISFDAIPDLSPS